MTASSAPCWSLLLPPTTRPAQPSIASGANELKDQLEGTWAVRPLELVRDGGRTMLLLEDADSVPIDRLLGVRVH
jgi:hypothetical protein